jgi:hypothetical protein
MLDRVSAITATAVFSVLSVVSTSASAVDVPEVSGPPLYPFELGEERKSRHLRNGKEMIQVTRLIDQNTGKSDRGDRCTWTFPREDA